MKRRQHSVRGRTSADIRPRGIISQSPPTTETVETRARELALIAGRKPNEVTESDRIQATAELVGDDSADAPVDDPGMVPSGMGAPPTSRGHQIKNHLPTDDETEARTVEEGVDEAEHDEMVQAAKTRTRSEG
jgi:hypothetical protein